MRAASKNRIGEDLVELTESAPAPVVAILLSTFNGARYLDEQLNSIVGQSYQNWRVLWRDDGSSDTSRAVMDAFEKRVGPERCAVAGPRAVHLGVAKSFLALLQEAEKYSLTAFADQDDVWLPDKLSRAVECLVSEKRRGPVLYCARQVIVGEHLERQALSPLPRFGAGFPSALLQNIVTGCTAVLNQEAVRLVNSVRPPDHTVHDWWSYIVVAAASGHVIFDQTPTILYRQHGRNAIGAVKLLWPRVLKALRRGSTPFLRQLEEHARALEKSEAHLSQSARISVAKVLWALSHGRLARVALMRDGQFRRQTRLENLGMMVWMLGKYNPLR
jgi:glycosyltransferase involved in cell wall biosynthesis